MFALCRVCGSPASLETEPAAPYVCPKCPRDAPAPAPEVRAPRRLPAAEIQAKRDALRRGDLRRTLGIAAAGVLTLLALSITASRPYGGLGEFLVVDGIIVAITVVVVACLRKVAHGIAPDTAQRWKCCVLALVMLGMQLGMVAGLARGNVHGGVVAAAFAGGFFVFTMLAKSLFRITVREAAALGALALATSAVLGFSLAFLVGHLMERAGLMPR